MDTQVMEYTSCTRLSADERAALDLLVGAGLMAPPRAVGSRRVRGRHPFDELQGGLDDEVGVVIQGRHVVAVG